MSNRIQTAFLSTLCLLVGCGQPTLPMPPTLNLPQPVANLTALRTGNTVTLHWTMPKQTTDKLPVKGSVQAEIWLRTPPATQPTRVATTFAALGQPAQFTYTLPPGPASGIDAPFLFWSIRLINSRGRTAGSIGPETITLGTPAIPPPTAVVVTSTPAGVHLSWHAEPLAAPAASQSILVHRVLTTPPPNAPAPSLNQKPTAAQPAANDMYLSVPGNTGAALDKTALWNAAYTYTLQRVTYTPAPTAIPAQPAAASTPAPDGSVPGTTHTIPVIETRSNPTEAISVSTKDIYPPAQPTGLAAVLGTANSVDLSWQPNTEPDLAGYIVYRRTLNPAEPATAQRVNRESISGTRITPATITVPAYRDATTEAGARYLYCIAAIDTSNNESPCSTAESITIP